MFNHDAYQRRLDEIKADIKGLVDQFEAPDRAIWHQDVSLRYGRFLAARTHEQLGRAIALMPGIELVGIDKQKHREHCAAELMGCVAGLHASSSMLRGSVLIADPVGAEAMMRIYDEANTAPAETEHAE